MSIKYFELILCALAICLVIPRMSSANSEILRIATEDSHPPFNEIDEEGHPVGFNVDIAQALCTALEKECSITAIAWNDLLTQLDAGRYDVVVASMSQTPARENYAFFSESYYRCRSIFVGDPSKPFIQTRQGLAGVKIATQTGTVQATYLLKNYAESSKIILTETIANSFNLLVNDQVDVVLSDSITLLDFLSNPEGNKFDFVGEPLPLDDAYGDAKIAINKRNLELVEAINNALKEIRISGEFEKINSRYFPFSIQ